MNKLPPKNALEKKITGNRKKWTGRNNNPNSPSADILALIDAIAAEGRIYRDEEVREERRKAIREWITIIVILATLIAVCWQVHEMVKVYEPIRIQAEAAITQANNSHDQLMVMQVAQRPWVKIESYSPKFFKIEKENINFGMAFTIKNIGKYPAIGIENDLELHIVTQDSFQKLDENQSEICGRGKRMYPSRTHGITLMPDESYVFSFDAAMNTNEALRYTEKLKHGVGFVVYGCLDYLLQSDNSHGQTGFRFFIDRLGPNNLPYGIVPQIGTTMGNEKLIVTKDLYGNYAY